LDWNCYFCNFPHTVCMHWWLQPPNPRRRIFSTVSESFEGNSMSHDTDQQYLLRPSKWFSLGGFLSFSVTLL
jgi:hypothetical protein